jgi:hypothetical protein
MKNDVFSLLMKVIQALVNLVNEPEPEHPLRAALAGIKCTGSLFAFRCLRYRFGTFYFAPRVHVRKLYVCHIRRVKLKLAQGPLA